MATDTIAEEQDFRSVHRLTPLLKLWTLFLALIAVAFANLNISTLASIGSFVTGEGSLVPLLIGVGGFVVVCLAVWALSRAWWKATKFQLTDEEVILKKGVLSKQQRSARYDRIQAVDVAESIIARIFRVASVRIETAGGAESAIEISYLTKPEAAALRDEVLAQVRGTPVPSATDPDNTAAEHPDNPDNPEPAASNVLVEEIPVTRTLASVALNLGNILGVVLVVGAFFTPIGLTLALPMLVGFVPTVWGFIDRAWRYNARLTPDGDSLDVSYGLADRRRQTIPLRRIHAVSISQPILWRLTGWWRVRVSVAGYGQSGNQKGGSTTLLPVGDRATALRLAETIGPLSPEQLDTVARPEGHATPDFTSPTRARWVSPIDLGQQSVTLLPGLAIAHTGRLSRSVSFIETSHIQELTLVRGPLQHVFHLCNVRFDLVAGPVNMAGQDLDVEDGRALLDALRRRELPALNSYDEKDNHLDADGPLDEHRPPEA